MKVSIKQGLRALLIQKDVKLVYLLLWRSISLRALLIQKDVKHTICLVRLALRLRALLIQKDVKLQSTF